MSVVLLILKIIGIILLAVIGIGALLLLAFVFWPAGYVIRGTLENQKKILVRVQWLFYLVCFHFQMTDDKKHAVLYILGIPMQIFPEKEKKHKKTRRKSSSESSKELQIAEIPTADGTEHTVTNEPEHVKPDTAQNISIKEEPSKKQEKSVLQKVKQRFEKVKHYLLVLPEKVRNICKKLSDGKAVITDESNQAALRLLLQEIKSLLSHYRPRRLKADIRYGFADPSLTGKSLAVLSMIPFLYQKKVQIVPDFEAEKSYVQGYIEASGHIRSFHLLRLVLHIWNDKNCKKFIRKLRK